MASKKQQANSSNTNLFAWQQAASLEVSIVMDPCGNLQETANSDVYLNGAGRKVKHAEAISICSSFGEGWGLASDRTAEDHQRLAAEMKKRGWDTMWLSHIKEELEHWTWLDGKKYTGTPSSGGNCGVYNRRKANKFSSASCMGESRRRYICKLDEKECPKELLASLGECVHHHGGVYLLGCTAPDWYSARSLCRLANGNLVSGQVDVTPTYSHEETCKSGNPWIGLHKEDWHYSTPGTSEYVNTSYWQVFADSQSYHKANTSVMRVSEGSYVWMAVESWEHHHVLCQNYKSELLPNGSENSGKESAFASEEFICEPAGVENGCMAVYGTASQIQMMLIMLTLFGVGVPFSHSAMSTVHM